MKQKQIIPVLLSSITLLPFFLASFVVFFYLAEYGNKRLILAFVIAFGGILFSAAIYWVLTKCCCTKKRRIIFSLIYCILFVSPLLSMKIPGRITYSRFGLTVYGCIPVPILDITVNSDGVLWFRDKSHLIKLQEVEALLSPDDEIVIIGIGWDNVAKAEEAIQNLKNIKIEILSTPEAYEVYNQYKAEGKKVVLIAHSTC